MSTDTILDDVERVSTDLARLYQAVAELVDRVADRDLQLADVRAERDQAHQLVEALQTIVQQIRDAAENSAPIDRAIGIVAAQAGVSLDDGRARLKNYSRRKRKTIAATAASIIADQERAALGYGNPEVARVIASAGIPTEFWKALTLNGAIFE
jgi:hypothetical protein